MYLVIPSEYYEIRLELTSKTYMKKTPTNDTYKARLKITVGHRTMSDKNF